VTVIDWLQTLRNVILDHEPVRTDPLRAVGQTTPRPSAFMLAQNVLEPGCGDSILETSVAWVRVACSGLKEKARLFSLLA